MMMSKRWMIVGGLCGVLAASACGSTTAQSEALAATSESDLGDDGAGMHFHLIKQALDKVALRPDQKAIVESLASEAKTRREPVKAARVALMNALADQVAAGKIDRAALKPAMDQVSAAIEQTRPQDRTAFVRLHDLLTPTQRNQFVDALEAQFQGGHQHHGDGGGGGGGFGRLRAWAEDLKLTSDQRDQIRSAMKAQFQGQHQAHREEWGKAREAGRALIESFRQEQFAIPDNAPGAADPAHAAERMERLLSIATIAVPVLTPEQRNVAAQKLRAQHP